ncbi:MAG: dTDP-4-dehydrorhamnose reductase [Thermofilaceae archaeon]
MKLLLTGASSLPGFRTVEEALERRFEVVAVHHTNPVPLEHEQLRKMRIDLTDFSAMRELVLREKPNTVVHMAALGDVDLCERNRALAWKVNVEATSELARVAERIGAYLLYLSTDYVFDGGRGMYAESDPPNPVNYYGLTKMAGEVAVKTACSEWCIVRTSSIYGLGPGRANFAKFLAERLSRSEPVKALIDQYTSPAHARLLACSVLELLEKRATGIYHVVGERMSRYEFALRVAEALGFDRNLVGTAGMEEFKWLARRPKDSSLSFENTKRVLSTRFYDTQLAMQTLRKEWEGMHQCASS